MRKIFIIIVCFAAFYSCKKDAHTAVTIPPPPKVVFKGNWEGLYTGTEDSGTFRVTVDSIGKSEGSVTSIVFDTTFQLSGNVNASGSITIAFGTLASGGTFEGILKDSTGAGTWENKTPSRSFKGTWTAKNITNRDS